MYNIDLYKYWQDPYSSDKKFTIHPLNDEGKEKYYSDQSHCTHYLKRSDPFVFKSIVGVDYDTLVRQQKHDIAQLNSLKNTLNQNHIEENKINENETYQKNSQMEENKMNEMNNVPQELNNKNETVDMNKYDRKLTPNRRLPIHKSMSSLMMRPYRKQKTFKDVFGYDNITSFKSNGEKYLYAINNMKKNNALEKKVRSLELQKFGGNTINDLEKNALENVSMNSLNDKFEELRLKNKELEDKVNELSIKVSDFNIYDLFDGAKMEGGNIDASKLLISALEQKVFKKIGIMDDKIKKISFNRVVFSFF